MPLGPPIDLAIGMKTIVSVELVVHEAVGEGAPGEKGAVSLQITPGHTADDLDQLIQLLGQARANQPPSTYKEDPKYAETVAMAEHPRMLVSACLEGRPILSFCHPGFGWTHFHLSMEAAGYLLERLIELLGAAVRPAGPLQ